MYEKSCYKTSTKEPKNRTEILISPRYKTHLFIHCANYSKVRWHDAKFTNNCLVP